MRAAWWQGTEHRKRAPRHIPEPSVEEELSMANFTMTPSRGGYVSNGPRQGDRSVMPGMSAERPVFSPSSTNDTYGSFVGPHVILESHSKTRTKPSQRPKSAGHRPTVGLQMQRNATRRPDSARRRRPHSGLGINGPRDHLRGGGCAGRRPESVGPSRRAEIAGGRPESAGGRRLYTREHPKPGVDATRWNGWHKHEAPVCQAPSPPAPSAFLDRLMGRDCTNNGLRQCPRQDVIKETQAIEHARHGGSKPHRPKSAGPHIRTQKAQYHHQGFRCPDMKPWDLKLDARQYTLRLV